jgi:glycosyltransferase involved in cell wall biosynthesis
MPVELASRLKDRGIPFILDMYGDGPLREKTELMTQDKSLSDSVSFHGEQDNRVILDEMCKHDIFLFTSDRREGWGAVVNEAMGCGCAVVAGDKIGSVPFMIKHRLNGCVFKNKDIDSLEREMLWLIDNPERLNAIRQTSKDYYNKFWTPRHAAESLLQLIRDVKEGNKTSIVEGPCSEAFPIKP